MDEFEYYFEDYYFVIDSDNLNSIKTKLYGFLMDNDRIIRNNNIEDLKKITFEGAFVYILEEEKNISIFQDYNGSYGLYYYKSDEYFAISNSFLKLVEYLKTRQRMTLNEDFIASLVSIDLCSVVYKETLVNEIEMIPRNRKISINKKTKEISFEKIDFEEHTIDLNSKQGLEILDTWFYKWINIIRSLKKKTNNLQFDLSGGFDTRIVLLLLLCANVDLNKVNIRSFTDGLFNHDADLEIAKELANNFNFNLNNQTIGSEKIEFKDIATPLKISFYTKLGFNNQLNYKFFMTRDPIYKFSGCAGEAIRGFGYGLLSPHGFIKQMADRAKKLDPSFEIPTIRIHNSSLNNLRKEFNLTETTWNVTKYIYPETRSRNHYGKLAVEKFFSNKLMLIPSLDPLINRLKLTTEKCKDSYLLLALIFIRYCPKLLKTKFEANRGIQDSTIEIAKEINNISPFEPKDLDFISGPKLDNKKIKKYYTAEDDIVRWDDDGKYIKSIDVDNYLKNIFRSIKFRKEFEKYFKPSLYDDTSNSFDETNYFSLHRSYPFFSVLKINKDIEFSYCNNNPKLLDWFDSYDKNKQLKNKTKYLIKKYGLFDYEFYKKQLDYEVNYDLLDHYLEIGYKEGKNPSKLFDANYYLNNNADVKKSGMNPLTHYVLYGMKENRGCKPVK